MRMRSAATSASTALRVAIAAGAVNIEGDADIGLGHLDRPDMDDVAPDEERVVSGADDVAAMAGRVAEELAALDPGHDLGLALEGLHLARIGIERFLGLVEEDLEGLRRRGAVLGAGEIGDVVLVDVEFGLREGRLAAVTSPPMWSTWRWVMRTASISPGETPAASRPGISLPMSDA